MKKFLSLAVSFFFGSWLIYQGALLLQNIWLFLVLLIGGILTVGLIGKYFLNKRKWRKYEKTTLISLATCRMDKTVRI